jgi:phosphatidylinositol alpha-1,6-mannosyltransferase
MTIPHLLVTNDFPPKIGGIQSVLWEWWRRLPPESVTVLTSPHPGAAEFDAEQHYRIIRTREPWLLPHPRMVRKVEELLVETGAELVVLDPAVPLGLIGPHLSVPYDVVLHGAEVTIPGRVPILRSALSRVLRGARQVISCGEYAAMEAERAARTPLPTVVLPPGVDINRFTPPLDDAARLAARDRLGIDHDAQLVMGVSRLVPRKGFDVAIQAVARLAPTHPKLRLLIAGAGRDEARLRRLINRVGAPAELLGRVSDDTLPDLYAAADLSIMLCRDRWAGLEQEGFGIVFLEAASAGVPQLAGRSGGSAEAVVHGMTGSVLDRPRSVEDAADEIALLLADPNRLRAMGEESRRRAVTAFTHDALAARLGEALSQPVERSVR